jgi:hypothetical protein
MAADPDEWVMPRRVFSGRRGLSASIRVARRSIVCLLERPDALRLERSFQEMPSTTKETIPAIAFSG